MPSGSASQPAACVFVDDLRENVAGAEAVGMTAILHRDPAETIAELERATRNAAQTAERTSRSAQAVAGADRTGREAEDPVGVI